MPKKKDLDGVSKLINRGKSKGFLTYDEVNDGLPEHMTNSEQLDDLMSLFGEMDIKVIDSATEKPGKSLEAVEGGVDDGADKESRTSEIEPVSDFESGVRSIGEVRQPSRRVNDVHTLSSSRSTLVSIPARNPRISLIGRSGISSIRPS